MRGDLWDRMCGDVGDCQCNLNYLVVHIRFMTQFGILLSMYSLHFKMNLRANLGSFYTCIIS